MNYINILGIEVPTYSLMILVGLIISNIISYLIIKRKNLNSEDFIIVQVYGLACGMIGAKLLYLFVNRALIDWNRIFDFEYFNTLMAGGFVFYGGLIGGFIGFILAYKIHKINLIPYLSNLIFCIPLVHGFGRIGCYFAGCCYGMPYDGPFYIEYHNIPYTLCDTKLFPVQLIEAICLFILALIFFILIIKKGASTKLIYAYLLSYSVLRFILEIFRFDEERGHVGLFSTSQWISLFIFVITIIIYYLFNNKNKN